MEVLTMWGFNEATGKDIMVLSREDLHGQLDALGLEASEVWDG
jgi:hypothetical protein